MKAKTNLTMLCDFYELTMANGYFQTGLQDRICYFDVFYRSVPDKGGFAIAAGLAQVVEYIQELCSANADCSPQNFWSFCGSSASPATSGPFPKAPRSSPTSRL